MPVSILQMHLAGGKEAGYPAQGHPASTHRSQDLNSGQTLHLKQCTHWFPHGLVEEVIPFFPLPSNHLRGQSEVGM